MEGGKRGVTYTNYKLTQTANLHILSGATSRPPSFMPANIVLGWGEGEEVLKSSNPRWWGLNTNQICKGTTEKQISFMSFSRLMCCFSFLRMFCTVYCIVCTVRVCTVLYFFRP